MARQLGKFNADTPRLLTDAEGVMTFSVNVDPEYRIIMQNIDQETRRLARDGKTKLVVTVQEYKNIRSIQQNAMMWKLLEIMAEHMNAGRTGGVTAWDCYLNMLEKYGAKYQYFMCVPEAVDTFKEMFRAVKEVERRDYNGVEMVVCKCYEGSSKYDTQEMSLLIDGILDILAELGVDSSEEAYLREEWEASKSMRHSSKG